MKILALDPASTCGWAHRDSDLTEYECGSWSLVVTPQEPVGRALVRLYDNIREVHKRIGFEVIAYENASFGSHNPAVQAMHNQKQGIIEYAAIRLGIKAVSYLPHQIKQFATGSGAAKKPQMIAAAKSQMGYAGNDDNAADALFIMLLAEHHKGLPIARAPKKKKPRRKVKDSDLLRLFK